MFRNIEIDAENRDVSECFFFLKRYMLELYHKNAIYIQSPSTLLGKITNIG